MAKEEEKSKTEEESDVSGEDTNEESEESKDDKKSEDSETSEDSSSKEDDYEEELEEEKKRSKKPDPAKAEEGFREREEKRKEKDKEGETPLSEERMRAILDEERVKDRERIDAEQAKVIVGNMTDNERLRSLVLQIYENRTYPDSMSLADKLEEAYLVANRKKIVSTSAELARALQNKDTVARDSASTHRAGMEGTAPKPAADMEASLKKAGYVYDNKSKVYKKTLPNGKILIKQSATSPPELSP